MTHLNNENNHINKHYFPPFDKTVNVIVPNNHRFKFSTIEIEIRN